MSINDLQNINNFRQTSQFIQVNSANINKQMSEEQNLFDTTPKKYSNQNTNEFLLFPSSNQYDDEKTSKFKTQDNLFL